MPEEYIGRLCRICMNESHSYSPIYEEIFPNNSMLFEVINDVCQLEVTMGDELPEHICSDCSFKLFEFRKFKMHSHEVQASLQRLKIKIEPEVSYDYASGRMQSFEECIGIIPDCLNLSTVDEEEYDVKTATPDPLDLNLSTVDKEEYDVKTATPDPLDLNLSTVDEEEFDVNPAALDPLDLNLSTAEEEKHDVNPETRDPLDVETQNKIKDPLCLDEDVNDDASDKEQELDLQVTDPASCATDSDASQDTYLAHEKTGMNIWNTVNVKKQLGRAGIIKERKTIDDPEEGTSYDARRPITCSNSDCDNFVRIQNSRWVNNKNGKYECDACIENSTRNTIIDKSKFHHSGRENPSNLIRIGIGKYKGKIYNVFKTNDIPISSHNNVVGNKNISGNGVLKKEKISSKNRIHNDTLHPIYKRKQYVCDCCGKEYRRKFHLSEHMTTHTNEKNFRCTICNKCFGRYASLRTHLAVHKKKCHICPICGKEFRQKGNVNMHLKIHSNERNYSCDICGKKFIQSTGLRSHLRTHTGERPFLCSVCGKGFMQLTDLQRHMVVHDEVKRFSCEICGYKLSTKWHYKSHMMRHGDEKPFSCDQCDKSFKVRKDLTGHLKVHSGLKPYKCSMCPKAFLISNTLKEHLRTHTGERPYSCPNCGKGFSQSHCVKRHMKSVCVGNIEPKI